MIEIRYKEISKIVDITQNVSAYELNGHVYDAIDDQIIAEWLGWRIRLKRVWQWYLRKRSLRSICAS